MVWKSSVVVRFDLGAPPSRSNEGLHSGVTKGLLTTAIVYYIFDSHID